MEQQIEDIGVGMLPQDVADVFDVHLRTIFRWIENGYISSREGRVNPTEVQRIVDSINSSCTKLEVRKKLGICCATLRSWRDQGILQFIEVIGTERVLRSSVDQVLEKKKGRRTNFHPDYVPVWHLLKVTGLECKVLNSYIESGDVKSEVVGGKRMIPIDEFNRLKRLMDSTLRPVDVARILQKSKDAILEWRRNGRLREVVVLGNTRVAVDSVAVTDEECRRLEIFLDTRRASRPEEEEVADKSDIRPLRVKDLGSLKVFTCKQAGDRINKPVRFVEELFRKGTLRGRLVEETIYIIASSLDVYEAKLPK